MRTISVWILSPVVVLCLLLSAGSALASPQGKGLHKKAIEAFNDGDYKKAKKLWVEAYATDKEPKYLYNLARMAQEMDHPIEASQYFERFLETAPTTPKYEKLIKNAKIHLAKTLTVVATVVVIAPQKGAQVVVAGRLLGSGPLRKKVRLKAGKHVVAVTLAGHHGETRTIELVGGDKRTLRIQLKKIKARIITKPGKLKYPLPRWLPWTGLGLGLAVAAGGAGSLVASKNTFDKYDRGVSVGNVDPDVEKSAIQYRSLGIGLLVVGGVIAGAGLIAVFLNRPKLVRDPADDSKKTRRPRPESSELMVIPVLGRTTGVSVLYRF